MNGMANYHQLVAKVDAICASVLEALGEGITCRRGCDSCCRHLTLFRVEAEALALAFRQALPERMARIRARLTGDACPLLEEGQCLLYHARPIICRTHGLPILVGRRGEQQVDFCPRNLQGLDSLPGSAVIDLERLNAALAAINALFVRESCGANPGPERIAMAEALVRASEHLSTE